MIIIICINLHKNTFYMYSILRSDSNVQEKREFHAIMISKYSGKVFVIII